jgi:carboxylesterase type B
MTLFGQSAGGASVDLLSLSPVSRDLFQKVIPMAGNASAEWAINENVVETCREKANSLGVFTHDSHKMIEQLRTLPAAKFGAAMKLDSEGRTAKLQTEIGPRIDGDFLPKTVKELRCDAPKKPKMIGVCEHEGLLLQAFAKETSFSKIERLIAERIPESLYKNFRELRKEALQLYIDPEQRMNKDVLHRAIVNLYSDLFLNIGTITACVEELDAGNEEVYLYSFDYFNPKSFGLLAWRLPFKGSTHCTELAYLFGVGIVQDFTLNEDDRKMIKITTKLWINFAKYGNPNGHPDDPNSRLPFEWLPISKEHPQRYLSIKHEPEMKEEFASSRPQFWLALQKKRTA